MKDLKRLRDRPRESVSSASVSVGVRGLSDPLRMSSISFEPSVKKMSKLRRERKGNPKREKILQETWSKGRRVQKEGKVWVRVWIGIRGGLGLK